MARAAMWRKALGADGKRIIDIRVTENHGEVAKARRVG